MTNTSKVYANPGKEFASYETADHSAEEYVHANAHTNTAEGHFSQRKLSIDRTHHHVSEKHLNGYLAEFDYRYTTRKEEGGTRTEGAIKRTTGKQLTYRTPVGKKSEKLV